MDISDDKKTTIALIHSMGGSQSSMVFSKGTILCQTFGTHKVEEKLNEV